MLTKRSYIILFLIFFAFSMTAFSKDIISVPSDPFSDIQDLDTTEQEEALERFYSYGRFIHLSFLGGLYMPFGSFQEIYLPGMGGGGRLSYFIDWDVAIIFQVGFGFVPIELENKTATAALAEFFTGRSVMIDISFGVKYYFNFYDISRSIAYLNPALDIMAGIMVLNDFFEDAPLNAVGDLGTFSPDSQGVSPKIYVGLSLEIPLFRKDVFIGINAGYHFCFFSPERDLDFSVETAGPYFEDIDYSGNFISFGAQLIWNLN